MEKSEKPMQSAGVLFLMEGIFWLSPKKGKSTTCQRHTSRRRCIAFAKGNTSYHRFYKVSRKGYSIKKKTPWSASFLCDN